MTVHHRLWATAVATLLAVLGAPSLSAQELPPEIQLDRLMVQADRQIAGEQYGAALRALDRILELQEQHDLDLPEPFWMKRAEVAVGAGNHLEAMASATRYLELAGPEGEHYEAALEVLDGAIASGCTPERMTETLESVRACLAAGADPNAVGEDGRTPLDWAERRADPAIAAALIAAGADPAVPAAAAQAVAATHRTLLQPVYFDCLRQGFYQGSQACIALRAETVAALRGKAQILRANPEVRLRLEGHTDERGTSEYNIDVGKERAEAIIRFFIGLGLSADRFTHVSYGEEKPAMQESNEEAWALNRRVEFVITAGGDSLVGAAPVARGAAMPPGTIFLDCEACPEMTVVPAGNFWVGTSWWNESERSDDDWWSRRVTFRSPFAVGTTEVTFAEWDACVQAGGCRGYRPQDEGWGRGYRPVINVSWEDAQEYVRWLSRETGEAYRLLSEAEWEYVARAGTRMARYWGEGDAEQCDYANGYDAAGHAEHGFDRSRVGCRDAWANTALVGSYRPNGFGLYDALGNVSEWTQDCWRESSWREQPPLDGTAVDSGDCARRVVRGGAWNDEPWVLRSGFRSGDPAGNRANDLGFRIARTVN